MPTPEFTREEKLDFMRSLMWDYNIPPEDCLEVLEGTREMAGHYTAETLFRKMLESYRWHTVIRLLPALRIVNLLSDSLINTLRFKTLQNHYKFIKDELPKALQATESGI